MYNFQRYKIGVSLLAFLQTRSWHQNVLDYSYCDGPSAPHSMPACVHLGVSWGAAMLRGSQTIIIIFTKLTSLSPHSMIGLDIGWQ